jgi:predicted patatin/cPLA2 family phospholipase
MRGLVLEGGGMRAGFVAGALMALFDKALTDFDVALAVSASVPTLAYFAAGQRKEMERVWRDELNSPKLVCYRNLPAACLALSIRRPVIDIDYLVYDVFKKKYPLNHENLMKARTTCLFAVTRLTNGRLGFLRADDNDIYESMRACMAIPGCYPGPVSVDGDEYVDGGTVNPLPVDDLMNGELEKVLAILSKPLDCEKEPPNFLERALFHRYFNRHDWMLDKLWEAAQAYNDQVSQLEKWAQEEPPKAFIISPDEMPPAKLVTRDHKKINLTVDMGYRKVEELEHEIRGFLRDMNT